MRAVPRRFVHVSVRAQALSLVQDGEVRVSYPVSTAAAGRGCRAGSLRTPTGVHRVAARIGARAPLGAVFRSRSSAGQVWRGERTREDLILTRILWLEGLEPGHNRGGGVDTYQRCIYVHGTNHEGRIGTPASHGCIRMRNADIVHLFRSVMRGTLVVIS